MHKYMHKMGPCYLQMESKPRKMALYMGKWGYNPYKWSYS